MSLPHICLVLIACSLFRQTVETKNVFFVISSKLVACYASRKCVLMFLLAKQYSILGYLERLSFEYVVIPSGYEVGNQE